MMCVLNNIAECEGLLILIINFLNLTEKVLASYSLLTFNKSI